MHWGSGFWPLWLLFWGALLLFVCWGASHWFGWKDRRGMISSPCDARLEPNALEILRRRYARGEIDGTTFDQMREHLERSGRPRD